MISPPVIPPEQKNNIDKLRERGFELLGWVEVSEAVLKYNDEIFVRVLPTGEIIKNVKQEQDKSVVLTNPEYWGFSGSPYEKTEHTQHKAYLRRKAILKLTINNELYTT